MLAGTHHGMMCWSKSLAYILKVARPFAPFSPTSQPQSLASDVTLVHSCITARAFLQRARTQHNTNTTQTQHMHTHAHTTHTHTHTRTHTRAHTHTHTHTHTPVCTDEAWRSRGGVQLRCDLEGVREWRCGQMAVALANHDRDELHVRTGHALICLYHS